MNTATIEQNMSAPNHMPPASVDEFLESQESASDEARDPSAQKRGRDSSPSARSLLRMRISQDWTQVQVAEMLRVDTRTVQKWEAGTARMPWASWALLNVFSGKDVSTLKYL